MKKQIKPLKLNKTKVSELSATNAIEVKGGRSGNIPTCPTLPLCFTVENCFTDDCLDTIFDCN